ncbi:hypothetical protein AVEN_190534-1, partial [Araneus ventricosus]
MECDRYGISDRTATSFASAVLQDWNNWTGGIVHELDTKERLRMW